MAEGHDYNSMIPYIYYQLVYYQYIQVISYGLLDDPPGQMLTEC
jgi:hypothetical protein